MYKGEVYEFEECKEGLYYYDTDSDKNKTRKNVKDYSFLQTVNENKMKYAKKDIEQAKEVTDIQRYFYWPGTDALTSYVENNLMNNCKTTIDDIKTRDDIYGTPIPLLHG